MPEDSAMVRVTNPPENRAIRVGWAAREYMLQPGDSVDVPRAAADTWAEQIAQYSLRLARPLQVEPLVLRAEQQEFADPETGVTAGSLAEFTAKLKAAILGGAGARGKKPAPQKPDSDETAAPGG